MCILFLSHIKMTRIGKNMCSTFAFIKVQKQGFDHVNKHNCKKKQMHFDARPIRYCFFFLNCMLTGENSKFYFLAQLLLSPINNGEIISHAISVSSTVPKQIIILCNSLVFFFVHKDFDLNVSKYLWYLSESTVVFRCR